MRTPFDILAEYERRSLAHAVALPAREDLQEQWRGVGYRIGSHRLVSGFDEVVEIVPLPPVTPVPGAQPWLLGIGNLRGNLFPVVDLKQFLQGERTVLHEGQRVLVMRQAGGDVALTIDELYGQRGFRDEQGIEPPEAFTQGRYGHFVTRAFHGDEQDWGVFALSLLARTPEFRQAAL
ncbi:chemotaxis protein CheW [Pseudoxanthomonas kalamensis DSM 18571]|uniref:chemotaxis protein CheW n=1 Tax=Pseudoxanthomonas kalamensis TaxID=289483 RepID=UPI00139133E6|nr:chemotaxis protein CheW [Pseudoxanthomonas kalamensis]KAF1709473.1 chemotaxis protein CheW [Pseudoxanthomonas kalamensis DSM 18571]